MNNQKIKVAYTQKEKILLASLIRDIGEAIENKKTDAVSLEEKQEAWNTVAARYNSQPEVAINRTALQLKKLWANLKQKKRLENTSCINTVLKTGGGPPTPEENDPLMELIDAAAPNVDLHIECPWDSTAAFRYSQDRKQETEILNKPTNNPLPASLIRNVEPSSSPPLLSPPTCKSYSSTTVSSSLTTKSSSSAGFFSLNAKLSGSRKGALKALLAKRNVL